MLFETERLLVRKFIAEDGDAFFSINGSEEVMKYIRPAKTQQEADQFLQENIDLYAEGSVIGRYAVVQKTDHQVIGTFSFLYLSGATGIHIGYALLPKQWGKGFATELTKTGTSYFFANTKKPDLFAITETANEPSQQVLLKAGFMQVEQKIEQGKNIAVFRISN